MSNLIVTSETLSISSLLVHLAVINLPTKEKPESQLRHRHLSRSTVDLLLLSFSVQHAMRFSMKMDVSAFNVRRSTLVMNILFEKGSNDEHDVLLRSRIANGFSTHSRKDRKRQNKIFFLVDSTEN